MRRKILDMQKLNPNWELAADHGRASKVGRAPKQTRYNSLLLCPCCLNLIDKEPVDLCENSKQLYFLGYGIPLFYQMLQFCMFYLFILILSESGVLIYLSVNEPCEDVVHRAQLLGASKVPYRCRAPFIIVSRITSHITDEDILIRVLSFAGQLLLMFYFRNAQRKLAEYHVERNLTIENYSIIFKNLPKVKGIQQRIKNFLKSEFKCRPEVEDIMLISKMDDFYEKQKEKETIIKKKKALLKDTKHPNFSHLIDEMDQQIQSINDELSSICRRIDEMASTDTLYCEKAIVIVNTEQQKLEILKQFPKIDKSTKQSYFLWMADEVKVKQAPNPKEIIWQNMNCPARDRRLRVVLGWIVSVIFLGLVTTIFYFLIRAKGNRLDINLHGEGAYTTKQYNEAVAIVFVTIIMIQLFNKFIMKAVLHKISEMEMPETTSQLEFSYAFKYTLGMFFTTAVMTLAVEAVQFNNYYGEYGVVEEETIMLFFNAFFVSFLWIIYPQYYYRLLMRKIYKGSEILTQKQANTLMEDFPYDMGKRYAQVLETMWFTCLYASLIPIGSIITLVGLVTYYWIDKYNLLRRSTFSNTIGSKLPINATKLMEFTIVCKPIGELIFDLQLRNNLLLPSTIVMIVIGIIYLLLPLNAILDCLFEEKFNIKTATYEESKFQFTEVYKTVDPIQRQLALDQFLNDINKNNKKKTMVSLYYDKNLKANELSEHAINLITSHNELNS